MLVFLSSGKQIYDEFLVDLFAHLIYPPADYAIQPSASSASYVAAQSAERNAYSNLNPAPGDSLHTITVARNSAHATIDIGAPFFEAASSSATLDALPEFAASASVFGAASWQREMAFAALLLFAVFVLLFVYALHIALPEHICDRRKIQLFEFKLRLANEHLCDLIEIFVGPVWRNKVLRLLTAVLFALQPSPPKWCRVESVRIGGVACRVYLPQGARRKSNACIVYIHGGGWCIMRPKYYDATLIPIVSRVGVPLISVDYTLSPEAHFGTAIAECERVIDAIYQEKHREYKIDRERIAIMGDSAGGNLAAVLAQRALRQGKASLFKCQVLIYPVIHMLDFLSYSYRYYYHGYKGTGLLNPRMMARWFLMYLGIDATPKNIKAVMKNQHISTELRANSKIMSLLDHAKIPEHVRSEKILDEKSANSFQFAPNEKLAVEMSKFLTDPDFCPLLGEGLEALAPALVLTAGVDILRDEGILYARRLRDDFGVAVEWRHYASAFHGVIHMPYSKQREQMFDDIADYLSAHLN